MVLVNPMVAVPTAAVFAARTGRFSALAELPPAWGDVATMAADLAQLSNDLEPPALRLFPVIAEVLEALRAQPGCFLARMSGSGATCFGLFADAAAAAAAVRRLTTPMGKHPWWCWSGAHGRTSSNPYAQPPVTSGFYGVS
jgi:4-diphosphocytidyl-2-C-methyl-D-erythritol kinase